MIFHDMIWYHIALELCAFNYPISKYFSLKISIQYFYIMRIWYHGLFYLNKTIFFFFFLKYTLHHRTNAFLFLFLNCWWVNTYRFWNVIFCECHILQISHFESLNALIGPVIGGPSFQIRWNRIGRTFPFWFGLK